MNGWRDRFERFVRRKEQEAADATLSPFTTELEAGASLMPIGNDWSRALFDGDFYLSPEPAANRPSASLVFVQSGDGNTGAADPATLGGGDTDKHFIYEGLSRVAADAVLAGAETVRGGDVIFSVWHPEIVALRSALGLPRHPIQIVATLRGMLFEDTLLYNVPELRVFVLTMSARRDFMREELAKRPWITPIALGGPDDLPAAFDTLREAGIQRVSAIGGSISDDDRDPWW
jgi:riboflavin biosynthesis pyrimidine reductase